MSKLADVARKRRAGEPLTVADRVATRKDAKERRARAIPLYFDTAEEKEHFIELAHADEYGQFSPWAIEKLRVVAKGGLHSNDDYQKLLKDKQTYEAKFHEQLEIAAGLLKENKDLNRRIQSLSEKLAELAMRMRR